MVKIFKKPFIILPLLYIIINFSLLILSHLEGGDAIDGYGFTMTLLAYPTTYFADLLAVKFFGLGYPFWVDFTITAISGIIHFFIIGYFLWFYIKWLKKNS